MAVGPSLAGFCDIVRLVGRGVLGGAPAPPSKGSKVSRSERKAQGSADTARLRREAIVGFGLLGGALLLIVSSFVAQLGLLSPGPAAPVWLPASSPAALQKALFSGELALIECLGARRAEPSAALREAAARDMLPAGLKLFTTDCDAPLPSGASLLERLGLRGAGAGQLTLLSASPRAYAPSALAKHATRSADALARALATASTPRFVLANSTLDLHRFCLRRKMCLLLLSIGSPDAPTVRRAARAHPTLPLVAINRRTHSVSFADMLPETSRPVLLALKPVVISDMAAAVVAFKGFLDSQEDVNEFVASAVADELSFRPLNSPPTVTSQTTSNEDHSKRNLRSIEDPEKAASSSMRELVI